MQLLLIFVALAQGVSPIGKVLSLLDDLQKKVVLDGEVEKKQYMMFTEWCEDTSVKKQYEIKNGKAKTEDLGAIIEKSSATAQNQVSTIEDLAKTMAANDRDLSAATEIRDKERADFETKDKDLEETVDMLGRAIGIIAKSMKGASFAQVPQDFKDLADALGTVVQAHTLGTNDEAAIENLLQNAQAGDDDFLSRAAPDASAYESHSSSILDTLEDLKDKAVEMREDTQKAELNAKHAHELLAQSLKDAMKVDGKALDESKTIKNNALEGKARAEGDLAMTTKVVEEATKTLQAVGQDCQTKASDFELSSQSRDEELKTLAEARRLIGENGKAAGDRAYGFMEVQQKQHFAGPKQELVQKLKEVGKNAEDVAMAQLALRVQAAVEMSGSDVFAKVRSMIQDMVDKLIAQAAEEADHKAWCDKETGDTQQKIEDHQSDVEELGGKIDMAAASIAQLTESVATTERGLADVAKQQSMINMIRSEQKAAFTTAKKDYEDGIQGLTMALQVLRDYYAKEATPTELVQASQPAVGQHSAAAGAATGIIGILEVAQSDFSKMLADAEAEESAAQDEYEKVTHENSVDKATKTADAKYERKEIAGLQKALADLKQDQQGEQAELDAVTEYYARVRPGCTTKPMTFEERKARRESEIAGLKEAMAILEGEAVAADLIQKSAAPSFLEVRRSTGPHKKAVPMSSGEVWAAAATMAAKLH